MTMRETAAGTLVTSPGGTAAIVIDHISGYRYSYPSWIQLRVGEHLVFDASDDTFSRPVRGLQADTPR